MLCKMALQHAKSIPKRCRMYNSCRLCTRLKKTILSALLYASVEPSLSTHPPLNINQMGNDSNLVLTKAKRMQDLTATATHPVVLIFAERMRV